MSESLTNKLLPILEGIQPAELSQQVATLSLAYCNMIDPKHPIYQLMLGPNTAHEERLQSRHPFRPVAHKLLNELYKLRIQAAQWTDYIWEVKCLKGQSELSLLVPRPSAKPFSMGLTRIA